MRLSHKEVASIKSAFSVVLADHPYELYLFGSRVDDNKKGGDIDLLVVVSTAQKSSVADQKTVIRKKIFESIPEQKIDITVATPEELRSDDFLVSIMEYAIKF
ncbi:MAG: hypothetical protein A2622_06825 [Bdellovibrionales bacterium RIFCSPHIGHO2_01_FULL_40_29]|nr:MAG: hypothetical protein A2622_06825 [Bdellovibrionales bacterium RIFCSPHIGHO2_01_FULL_40_29]OFZ35154.1 MAG: hypothetical protein A3D17_07175 [Bdellovibrionales bacterium RIFCSPHIGHO2_02_FULL_40_15]